MADKYSKKKSTIINATTWLIKSRNFGRTCAKHTWLAFTPWEPTKYTKIWRQESYCLLHPPSLLVVFWLIFHCFKGDSDRKWCKQMENIVTLSKIITEKIIVFGFVISYQTPWTGIPLGDIFLHVHCHSSSLVWEDFENWMIITSDWRK